MTMQAVWLQNRCSVIAANIQMPPSLLKEGSSSIQVCCSKRASLRTSAHSTHVAKGPTQIASWPPLGDD